MNLSRSGGPGTVTSPRCRVFVSFNLLQGPTNDEYTLMSSHAVWESKQAFEGWLKSDAFKKAHANAGGATRNKDLYLGPPQFEGFEAVL